MVEELQDYASFASPFAGVPEQATRSELKAVRQCPLACSNFKMQARPALAPDEAQMSGGAASLSRAVHLPTEH